MKKAYIGILLLLVMSLVLSGCFQKNDNVTVVMKKGDLALKMDFSVLTELIGQVTIICTNPSYDTITQNLTINGKVAQGIIMNLPADLWHIRAEVYDDTMTLIYSSESDVTIVANTTINCDFIFEPANEPGNTGNLAINVIINDFQDHVLIPQHVADVILDDTNNYFYVLDSANKNICAYSTSGYNKMKEFSLPEYPTCFVVSNLNNCIYVAFTSGHIGRIDTTSGVLEIIFSDFAFIDDMITINSNLVIRVSSPTDHYLYSLNPGSREIINSVPIPMSPEVSKLQLNTFTSKIYFSVTNAIDPINFFSITIDPTGMLGVVKTVPGVENEIFGPIRFIRSENYFVTPAGNLYQCASDDAIDIAAMGSSGFPYWDLTINPLNDMMYLINRFDQVALDPTDIVLKVVEQTSFFHWHTEQVQGVPRRVFFSTTTNEITLVVENENAWYFTKLTI